MLADSDDLLEKDCVRKKVEYLEQNPEQTLVAGRAKVVNENNMDKVVDYLYNKSQNWCEDIVYDRGVKCCCGMYMIKTENFLKIYPERKIFESRYGQNYQILIPLMYYFKYGTIDDIVYTYIIRQDSLSHNNESIYTLLKRYDSYIEILENTTDLLPKDYKKDYMNKVYSYFAVKKFRTGLKTRDAGLVKVYFDNLQKFDIGSVNILKYKVRYLIFKLKMLVK